MQCRDGRLTCDPPREGTARMACTNARPACGSARRGPRVARDAGTAGAPQASNAGRGRLGSFDAVRPGRLSRGGLVLGLPSPVDVRAKAITSMPRRRWCVYAPTPGDRVSRRPVAGQYVSVISLRKSRGVRARAHVWTAQALAALVVLGSALAATAQPTAAPPARSRRS